MSAVNLVLHGHFYQPPRENPWTEVVPREPSATPFHDWNARITDECYRPNAAARIVDDGGRVLDIVDNYRLLSCNVGPTLAAWLEAHEPDVYDDIVGAARGAIAQVFGHLILPLAHPHDVRTQVRWGLADFAHRFGRPAKGMWLSECAVSEDVLAVLAEEGVGCTILAPGQIGEIRRLGEAGQPEEEFRAASEGLDVRRPLRWVHPTRPDLTLDLVVYDGGLSHDVAFDLGRLASADLVRRVVAAAGDASEDAQAMVCVATDGETFGHHHRWAERNIAYALSVEARRQGVGVRTAIDAVGDPALAPTHQARVATSAWSCAHGVGRWERDCGCSTGGEPGWNQAWRGPLRAALDLLRDAVFEVATRRSPRLFSPAADGTPGVWGARDAWIDAVIGVRLPAEVARSVLVDGGDGDGNLGVEARTLLEAMRAAMAMYTSCGWFFNDLAGIETVQVLRYAARCLDLLADLGEPAAELERAVVEVLAEAHSNRVEEGSGADIWRREVLPSRVDPGRVAAHLALASALAGHVPGARIAAWDVHDVDHQRIERGPLAVTTLAVRLVHRRTGRSTAHVATAIRLGGLEVLGVVRPGGDATADGDALRTVRSAVVDGAPITRLLSLLANVVGGDEFGLEAALPDSAEQLLGEVGGAVVERFGAELDRLLDSTRPTLEALVGAGFPLPPSVEGALSLALTHQIEAEVVAQDGSLRLDAYADALALARSPLLSRRPHAGGAQSSSLAALGSPSMLVPVMLEAPSLRRLVTALLDDAVEESVNGDPDAAAFAVGLLALGREIGVELRIDRPQAAVLLALRDSDAATEARLGPLGIALGLAVGRLGLPA